MLGSPCLKDSQWQLSADSGKFLDFDGLSFRKRLFVCLFVYRCLVSLFNTTQFIKKLKILKKNKQTMVFSETGTTPSVLKRFLRFGNIFEL